MINKFFNYIVVNFGFDCKEDFSNSIIHNNLLAITIPLAAISSVVESLLGLHSFTLVAFLSLIMLELITGLIASKVNNIKIESHKFSRFGLKILVWLTLIYISNTLIKEYNGEGGMLNSLGTVLFTWLHGTLFIYITLEYFISVLENLGVITGKSNKTLIGSIKDKLYGFLKNDKNS